MHFFKSIIVFAFLFTLSDLGLGAASARQGGNI